MIEIDGKQLYYEVSGKGSPLVLIHSALTHSGLWDNVIEGLAAQYQVIRYDLYGYGKSVFTEQRHINHGADLKALLEHLSLPQAAILGESMGAEIALSFALDYPAMVDKLILVSAGLEGYDYPEEAFAWWGGFVGAMQTGDFDRAVEIFITNALDSHQTPLTPDQITRIKTLIRGYGFRHYLDSDLLWWSDEIPPAQRLGEVICPTLVMVGEGDRPIIKAIADHLVQHLPNTKFATIQGAGHLVHLQQPAAFNEVITTFLAG